MKTHVRDALRFGPSPSTIATTTVTTASPYTTADSRHPSSNASFAAVAPPAYSIIDSKSVLFPSPISISPAKLIKPVLTSSASSSSTSSSSSSYSSTSSLDSSRYSYTEEDEEALLHSIFPVDSPLHALPLTPVNVGSIVDTWRGAVVEDVKKGSRTLYVVGGRYEDVNLRESVCGVLELAEEELGCTGVVMVLEKDSPDLGEFAWHIPFMVAHRFD